MMMMNYSAIIMLGGKGTRFGGDINKVYYLINNKPLFCYPLELFLNDPDCKEVIVVYNREDEETITKILLNYPTVLKTIGGSQRYQSVLEGLRLSTSEYVLVHDGARPNINSKMIEDLKEALSVSDAVSLGVAVSDTIKKVTENGVETIARDSLYAIQTPQGANRKILLEGLLNVKPEDNITDDLMVIEKYSNVIPKIVLGDKHNIKVTTKEDYQYIKFLMGDKDV